MGLDPAIPLLEITYTISLCSEIHLSQGAGDTVDDTLFLKLFSGLPASSCTPSPPQGIPCWSHLLLLQSPCRMGLGSGLSVTEESYDPGL
jgi:hypothetical protein